MGRWWSPMATDEIVLLVFTGLQFLATLGTFYVLLNANVPHTYTKGREFGVLFSLRGQTEYNNAYFYMSFRVWVPFFVLWMLIFRRVFKENTGCSFVWTIVLFTLFILEVLSLVPMGAFYSHCNNPDMLYLNPCNSNLLGCSDEVRLRPGSPVIAPCGNGISPVRAATLPRDPDFQLAFALNLLVLFFDVAILIISMWGTLKPLVRRVI